MLARVLSSALLGIDAYRVEVEVDLSMGLPYFTTVGLAEGALRESKERVRAAIRNTGYALPSRRITVNLAPACIKKEGSAFDLPIAVGILMASGQVRNDHPDKIMILGELSLDGRVKPIRGGLSIALAARKEGISTLIIPRGSAAEAAVVEDLTVLGVESLAEVTAYLNGEIELGKTEVDVGSLFRRLSVYPFDFKDVKGQESLKRAVEVAAAGGHNIIMIGPPGTGKTMLAQRISTILPDMTFDEALETTKIHSVAGRLPPGLPLVAQRPFRAPHHSISDAGLLGGGSIPRPGEVSLAHNGVLFLDELPEFRRNVIEVLRIPLEEGVVRITRVAASLSFPARSILVASMNPCPCGFATDPARECTCTPPEIQRYVAKVSGPLLDRIDIHIDVPPVRYQDLAGGNGGEPSSAARERVNAARAVQTERLQAFPIHCNAQMAPPILEKFCRPDAAGERLLKRAIESLGLSARAYSRILKVARTIADLDRSEGLKAEHIAEAIQYRTLDRVRE